MDEIPQFAPPQPIRSLWECLKPSNPPPPKNAVPVFFDKPFIKFAGTSGELRKIRERRAKLWEYLSRNPMLTSIQLKDVMQVTYRVIHDDLSALRCEGMVSKTVKQIGRRREAHWKAIEK